jgi:ribose/xylose/arabinose/galactoside ABC-type transport system permease subunit
MKQVKKFLGSTWGQRATILIAVFIIMAIGEPKFFTGTNWASILLAIALYGIMACGMLFVVLIGGMDLSMGSVAACAGSYLAFHWVNGGYTIKSFVIGLILGLLAGVVVGLLHGVLVAYLNLPAFVVTLATKYLIYGYVILYTNGSFVYALRQEGSFDPFYSLGNAKFLGLTMPVWIFFIVVVITAFILGKTTYGRRLYAVGGSPQAAEFVGINTKRSTIIAFVASAVSAAIGGMILVSMNMVAGCTTASGYEGSVLMAMVVGGINLAGGEGGVSGAVFGALLVGIINNMIILLEIPSDYTKAIQGVVIIVAVAINIYTARKAAGIISPRRARKLAAAAAKAAEKEKSAASV